jgi:hypothetical protein
VTSKIPHPNFPCVVEIDENGEEYLPAVCVSQFIVRQTYALNACNAGIDPTGYKNKQ